MNMEHWFWLILTLLCLGWYGGVTLYVAVRGLRDIRKMLDRLAARKPDGS